MERSPAWVRLLQLAVGTLALFALLAGPPPFVWRPSADDRWLWSRPDLSTVDGRRSVIVLDPFPTGVAEVTTLHATGHAAVCRLRAGIWETDRPDAARVDDTLLGEVAAPRARWLDIRRIDALATVLADRLNLCVEKGFDGVVLDDLDGYAHPTGFPLSLDDQLAFNTTVVGLARRAGLRVAVVVGAWTPVPSDVDVTVTAPR